MKRRSFIAILSAMPFMAWGKDKPESTWVEPLAAGDAISFNGDNGVTWTKVQDFEFEITEIPARIPAIEKADWALEPVDKNINKPYIEYDLFNKAMPVGHICLVRHHDHKFEHGKWVLIEADREKSSFYTFKRIA